MRTKVLTPQQRWNRKHKSKINKSSKKYYYRNRKVVLKKSKVRYYKKKQLKVN